MNFKDLSKEPPRSPHYRIHDYVILARTLDKCRASINKTLGDYHFNCPLDKILFEFKGIDPEDFLKLVESGAGDEEIGGWLDKNGTVHTAGDISDWSKKLEAYLPYQNPDKKSWFIEQCKPLDLNPAETTLFGYLEADDLASFPNAIQVSPDSKNWDLPMVETAPTNRRPSSLKGETH